MLSPAGDSQFAQIVFSIGYDFHFGTDNNGNVFGIRITKTTTPRGNDALSSLQLVGANCSIIRAYQADRANFSTARHAWEAHECNVVADRRNRTQNPVKNA